jgi:hypothetical protein
VDSITQWLTELFNVFISFRLDYSHRQCSVHFLYSRICAERVEVMGCCPVITSLPRPLISVKLADCLTPRPFDQRSILVGSVLTSVVFRYQPVWSLYELRVEVKVLSPSYLFECQSHSCWLDLTALTFVFSQRNVPLQLFQLFFWIEAINRALVFGFSWALVKASTLDLIATSSQLYPQWCDYCQAWAYVSHLVNCYCIWSLIGRSDVVLGTAAAALFPPYST